MLVDICIRLRGPVVNAGEARVVAEYESVHLERNNVETPRQ